jgi:hypothetical protein
MKWKTTSRKRKRNKTSFSPLQIKDDLNFVTLEYILNYLKMEDDLIFI